MLRRHFFLVGALTILVLMILFVTARLILPKEAKGGAAGRGGMATPVSVTTAQPRDFHEQLDVLGVAKGRQSVTLTAATTQLVDQVRFRDGQSVPRGAVLVELKATEEDAGIAQAEAKLVEAKRAYDRYRTLGEQGYVSKAAVDQYEATWRSAQADVAAAKARQGDRVIRAPFAGVVGLTDVTPGALVNPGAPIVTLDDLSAVRVDFQTPELYLTQLRPGMAITATADAYPGQTFSGRISTLDTRVDARTRAITARAEFPNADRRLKSGMLMRVKIARGTRQALAATESAVSMQNDTAFVFLVGSRDGKPVAEQRPVVTGLRQNGFVEIRDGLRQGDRLVADGLNKIQAGQPIRPLGGKKSQPKTVAAEGRPAA